MLQSQKQLEKALKKQKKFKLQKKHSFKKVFLSIALATTILTAGASIVSPYLQTQQVNNDIVTTAMSAVDDQLINDQAANNQLEISDVEAPPSNAMLEEARQINPDICGFITGNFIQSENHTLPVLQGDTDDEYLNKQSDGTANAKGSLGMVTQNDSQNIMNNKITLVQGHNLLSEQMLGALDSYQNQEYLKQNPTFTYCDAYGEYQIDIISAGYQDATHGYYTNFDNNENFIKYIDYLKENSMTKSDVQVNEDDNVFMLSTCPDDSNYNNRFIVEGKVTQTKVYRPSIENLDNTKTR